MAILNTINFLPEVFRSSTNQRFLGATMDQLLANAVNIPINGYIGRTFAPTYKLGDNYVPEFTTQRSHYQLEPSIVIKDNNGDVVLNSGYLDLLQSINNNSGFNNNHQRLFSSPAYSFDGHFDYDKFVNYNNYYWLPNGPASVTVTAGATPLQADYTVTQNSAVGGYTFSGHGSHPNTQLTLARGGTYNFNIDQLGSNFWIQTKPGTTGLDPAISTLSTREVFGVTNNGTNNGVIRFNVPQSTAQDFYNLMPIVSTVNAAVSFNYTDIQNQLLSTFLTNFPDGLDGIVNQLQGKTFIFIGNTIDTSVWTTPALPAGFTGTDTSNIRPGDIIPTPGTLNNQFYAPRTGTWEINLVPSGSDYLIQLHPITSVATQQKVFPGSGKTYASVQFWLNNNYQYNIVPTITATNDYLYYQDSNNPDFVGQIKLVDNVSSPINVTSDIIGNSSYTSPNGVIFTNGLKIQFDSLVVPAEYANNEYYVEGVGTSILLAPVDQMIVPEPFGQNIATATDYITINRASQDRNAWSRSNRWFHVDVLNATALYNNTVVDYGPNIPGRRAIIEFEPNLQLFNYGKQAKNSVDLITFVSTDAFVDFEGQASCVIDGVTINYANSQGMRIIFANDYDYMVKNEIWQVDFELINGNYFLRLIVTADDPVLAGESVLVTQGSGEGSTFWFDGTNWHNSQIKSTVNQAPLFDLVDSAGYSFSDVTVYPATTFTGTKFFGYPVITTGTNDSILGFPLSYQNFNNIGDILFSSYYDVDSFNYLNGTSTSTINCNSGYLVKNTDLTSFTKLTNWIDNVSLTEQYQIITKFFDGHVVEIDNNSYAFVQIDILPTNSATIPHLKVYLNNAVLNSNTDYQIVNYGIYYMVILTLPALPVLGDKIDVAIFSDSVSALGYYEIPKNLDYNPLNQSFPTVGTVNGAITLGQLRTHYNKLVENTTVSPTTEIPSQDRYLKAQGGTLLQQSSPAIYAMTFLTDPIVNFVDSITLARKEYQRFKNKFLSLCSSLTTLDYTDPMSGVDTILQNINLIKNSSFPWYYSDMVPQGNDYVTITYNILNRNQKHYEINGIFDVTKLSNRAVLVYLNGTQLLSSNIDYSYNPISPEIIINVPLAVGDVLTIRDYANTDGNYIPATPIKLGLAHDYPPRIYLDTTYQTPTNVILGHDGSRTPAFGDFRDQYLLELEKRIYNNLKTDFNTLNVLNPYNTIPGRFRSTDYSLKEWNQLLTQNFLQWVGSNNIDYTSNTWYDANNPWSWNYNQFTDVVDGSTLQGSWRAIYNHWFDTDQPHLAPWEMLGFAEQPSWWTTRYGPAPYTSGNTTLWDDLSAGYVWNGSNTAAYTDTRFIRPGLTQFIPVDSAGNLLPPLTCGIVKQSSPMAASSSFQVGEQGPVETAWRRSSDFTFAVQQALALARPAEYFSTQIDLSRFYLNPVTGQFSNDNNQKISPTLLVVNGDTVTSPGTVLRTAGYLNWIADYIKNRGIDPVTKIENYFKNFSVQLAYKVAGFTDQNLISVTAEQTSPGSTNASIIIPDENYTVYLGKPVPVATITYSGVIVTRNEAGYSVSGYDTVNPYFVIFPSIANNQSSSITVNNLGVKVYQTGSTTPLTIPYGTTFATVQQVADFLISYQRHLVYQGFRFTSFDSDLQTTRDWSLSIKEFLFWVQQNWNTGTILVLNPIFDKLDISLSNVVIDEITNLPNGTRLLNTNFAPIKSNNFDILRVDTPITPPGNITRISTTDGLSGIAFARLDLIQFENTLIFDNIDNFGDILYIPEQGTRQFRLKIRGAKTGAWTGALSPAGYVYSNPKILSWRTGTDYKQGDIVSYNSSYYTAPSDILASQNFALTQWTKINLSDIQTGLLPSLGHNAQIFQNIYDIDNPPQDENFQIFSAGLIGFRERPFLSNLGLGIPTQTKFYQGYIHQKGTTNSITSLTKATFGTINSTISTYEEWALQVGQYGAINGNQFTEFVLDQSVFLTNPVAFTATNSYNTGNIIVNLAVTGNTVTSNVYNASNLSSTSTSLCSNRTNDQYSTDLPTAGYVNLADIDYQIFDITTTTTVPTLAVGNKIWVAKDFTKNWNVYRVNSTSLTATTLTYTLDSYAQLTFNTTHSFSVGDTFVLQSFNSNYHYNGLYQVVGVPTTSSVTIVLQSTTEVVGAGGHISGLGSVYQLKSMVINSYSQIASITPPGGWATGDKVWINIDTQPGATGWAVYNYASSTWTRTRQQQSKVDITTINRTFIFDKSTNVISAAIDFIDPAKAKVLNAVGVDIDHRLTADPASYNQGTGVGVTDFHWGPQQVGKIWWDLDAIRYIDYEQDALIYRLMNWGNIFPDSNVVVCEWVDSPVLPSQYATTVNDGVALYPDDSAYSTYGSVGPTGAITLKYYYWVINKTTINTAAGKSNSVYSIAAAIENPQAQGIPYATVLRNDTFALYNVNRLLTGKNSVLHIESKNTASGLIHSEYALVQEGNPNSPIPSAITNKLIDSLSQQDEAGNAVPDPELTLAQAFGISIRPRQGMFIDPTLALNNYITFVNNALISYPVIENKLLTTLNSSEVIPNTFSGAYDQVVETIDELNYIDTGLISSGYKVLINNDSTQHSKWTIYTWNTPIANTWNLTRTQSYKTNAVDSNGTGLYWYFVDWYQTGYDNTITPDTTVANLFEYGKLTLLPDTHIKVLNNGNNQFVVYYIDNNLVQNVVGIQNGTIQISTNTIPPLELREILTAIQNDILIEDLALKYNQLFFAMVKYTLTEQKNLDWVFKTSFLSATQYIRALAQFPSYIADNQDYYLDYINEVKPYRTTIREFVVDYQGDDQYLGDPTDFDLPPYWDANLQIYRGPSGEQPYDSALLSSGFYSQWNNNYKYQVIDVTIENAGSGYVLAPQITITGGGATVNATAYATINAQGGVHQIIIVTPGENYTSIPNIIINGTGSGAVAYAILRNIYDGNNTGHNLVRSIDTRIKFDRTTYTAGTGERLVNLPQYSANTFVMWDEITTANIGQTLLANTIINADNRVYVLANSVTINSSVNFPIANAVAISANAFSNANDRIFAFNGNINLTLTQTGLEYPGVKVDGNTFVGNVYDSTIYSFYGNTLGVNPYDINVDGGGYVTTFTSHAPEELIPGYMRDSLNLTVYNNNNANVTLSTQTLAFRLFEDMVGNTQSYRIANANITTLTSNLNLTDTNISVVNASLLALPNPTLNIPGVVIINGEKITYWRNYAVENKTPWTANAVIYTNSLITYNSNIYLTTGNVYGAYFANITANVTQVSANTLAQIRRGVDGTYTPNVHASTSRIVDSSTRQLVPNSASVSSNIGASNKTYTVTGNVSYKLQLSTGLTANVGDYINQKFANAVVAANVRVLGNVTNSGNIAVIFIAGNITTTLANTVTVNGTTATNVGIISKSILGRVDSAGNATVVALLANSTIQTGNVWTSTSSSLSASTTEQAVFLTASPGFKPTAGQTP